MNRSQNSGIHEASPKIKQATRNLQKAHKKKMDGIIAFHAALQVLLRALRDDPASFITLVAARSKDNR